MYYLINPLKAKLKSHLPFTSIIRRFNVYGLVHCKYIPIYVYIQQDAMLRSLFISGNCSTCFGWYFHPSSGAHTTVSTASDICHTVTAICCYHGRAGTGLSVLWVAYADDGWKYHPKHVQQFPDINKLCNVASCWIYIGILLAHPILHISRIRLNYVRSGCEPSVSEQANTVYVLNRTRGLRIR
jgi:hypothetical protein